MLTSVWLAPAVLAALVCGYRIGSIGLWWDELTTYDVSRRSVAQILHTLGSMDAVHGADYLFMHFWMDAFGTSLISLRIPGLLASVGTAVVTALTAKKLAGPRAGIVAGLVIALTPSVARYASEVRSYPIVVLAATLSTLMLVRALERPGSAGRWVAYAAALTVAGLFNLLVLTILAGHAVGVFLFARSARHPDRNLGGEVGQDRRESGGRGLGPGRDSGRTLLKGFIAAALAAAVLVSPIMYLGHEENPKFSKPPAPTLVDLVQMWPAAFCTVGGSLVVLVAVMAALVRYRSDWRMMLPAAITVLPILVLFVASFAGFSYFNFSRYAIFVAPAGAVLVGQLSSKIRSWTAAVAVVLVFAAAVSFDQYRIHRTFAHFWYNYPGKQVPPTDYKSAADFVAKHYQPGDEATFTKRTDFTEGVNYYLPSSIRLNDILVTTTSWQLNAEFPTYCADLDKCVDAGPKRVWLFASTGNPDFTADDQAEEAALATKYHEVLSQRVTGIDVILMVRNS